MNLKIVNLAFNEFYGPLPKSVQNMKSLLLFDVNKQFLEWFCAENVDAHSKNHKELFSPCSATTHGKIVYNLLQTDLYAEETLWS